jgi:hypothetical protein
MKGRLNWALWSGLRTEFADTTELQGRQRGHAGHYTVGPADAANPHSGHGHELWSLVA